MTFNFTKNVTLASGDVYDSTDTLSIAIVWILTCVLCAYACAGLVYCSSSSCRR